MNLFPPGSRPTRSGPTAWFTGHVWLDEITAPAAPSRLKSVRVTFAPGARTAWHTHPIGQTLHIISGVGLIQLHGGPPQTLRPGDTVSILPNELHWHGAAPTHAMVHLAMQEADDSGTDVIWLQHVTDEEYSSHHQP